jgi:predicted helicase
VFHLRGNQRTAGELSRKEGGKIFGSGSRAPIAISLLVKNPNATTHGGIYFYDIGDYLSREEKLERIDTFTSVAGITNWQSITPDDHGDWLKQRDDSFSEFMVLGDKKTDGAKLFENYSLGVATNRDAWTYNSSQNKLQRNMVNMIDFYNAEVSRFNEIHQGLDKKAREVALGDFIDTNPGRISWTRSLKQELAKNRNFAFEGSSLVSALYRPFTKQWMYFNRTFNEMVLQMPRIFPAAGVENLVIMTTGRGSKEFSLTISNTLPDLNSMEAGAQCFPLYLYDEKAQTQPSDMSDLFQASATDTSRYPRRDAITDGGLRHFQDAYPGEVILKEDLFYYVYGLMHSREYRERYADNLSKELPRIPRVKTAGDFWLISKAGRDLAQWHLNYENVALYPLTIDAKGVQSDADYRVEKMKFAKKGDKSTVIYNAKITLRDIPPEAWDYIVNGQSALHWVMERQGVKTDKASGIVNDANDWAIETMGNPRYPLELFQRVVTVSLETQKIVASLPKLDI